MQHTATKRIKTISALLVFSFLIAPLTTSAMFLDKEKRTALCTERALEAQERQIQSAEYLINNTEKRLGDKLDQYGKDIDFAISFDTQVTSLADEVATNVMAIVTGNITLDVAGLAALRVIAKRVFKVLSQVQKFYKRIVDIHKRWSDIPNTLTSEVNRVRSYANNIAKQTYARSYNNCMTGW